MCEPVTSNLEKRRKMAEKTITITPRWIADWLIRVLILLATSFAGLAWGQVRGLARSQQENHGQLTEMNLRLVSIEGKVGEGPTDRIDDLEARLSATEQNRFTSEMGREVWRELDSKVDRDELTSFGVRVDERFNRLDDKLDRLITLAGE